MRNEQSRGIRAGLEHERERIERIATGAQRMRPELERRRVLIVEELRRHHAHVELLLYALDQARAANIEHLRGIACRAWRDLRTRILEVLPQRGHATIRPSATPPEDERHPGMRCFQGTTLASRSRAAFGRGPDRPGVA